MNEDRAITKVLRWSERQTGPFTRQICWQANKGGTIRSSVKLTAILGAMVSTGMLTVSEPEPGKRSELYQLAGSELEAKPEPASFPPVAVETIVKAVEPVVEPAIVDDPVVAHRMSDDEVLVLAAQRRRVDGRIEYALEQIEQRNGHKRAGDLLRGTDLSKFDQAEMSNIRKWLGTEPTIDQRFSVIVQLLKNVDEGSPKRAAITSITDAVRVRNQVKRPASLPVGYFRTEEIEQLEAILGGGK